MKIGNETELPSAVALKAASSDRLHKRTDRRHRTARCQTAHSQPRLMGSESDLSLEERRGKRKCLRRPSSAPFRAVLTRPPGDPFPMSAEELRKPVRLKQPGNGEKRPLNTQERVPLLQMGPAKGWSGPISSRYAITSFKFRAPASPLCYIFIRGTIMPASSASSGAHAQSACHSPVPYPARHRGTAYADCGLRLRLFRAAMTVMLLLYVQQRGAELSISC